MSHGMFVYVQFESITVSVSETFEEFGLADVESISVISAAGTATYYKSCGVFFRDIYQKGTPLPALETIGR